MKQLFLLFSLAVLMVSCSETYRINGTTSLTQLEGNMLYLKVYDGNKFASIDSCAVMHGHFSFKGSRDSVEMALIYNNDRNLMPVMLDGSYITVSVTETSMEANGSAMNDSLYAFIAKKAEMDEMLDRLSDSFGQRIMDGEDVDYVTADLAQKKAVLDEMIKNTFVDYIKKNYSNAIGVGMFMLVTMDNPYPLLTPRIEEVYTGAGAYFLGNPYVKRFFSTAEENMLLIREGKEPVQM